MGGVPERTVYEQIAAGRLKSFKVGKRRLIRVVDIEAFLERRALLDSGATTARRCTSTRQPRLANDGPVIPFPEFEPGGQTTQTAPSAAKRPVHRAARTKTTPSTAMERAVGAPK